MSSSAIFASMVSDAVCQAIRYPGIMPSSLWSSGPWPHIGVADERPYMSELVRGPPLLVTDLGDLVATAMVRFCGVELPQSFCGVFQLAEQDRAGPGTEAGRKRSPTMGHVALDVVTPHSLPPEVLTTLSEPGWPRAPNDLLSKTLKVIQQPATGRVTVTRWHAPASP